MNGYDDEPSNEEIARRRDDTLLRMLKTPPKLHKDMKLGKPRRELHKSPKKRGAVKK